MMMSPTIIDGVWLMEIEPHPDERGFFARTWCRQELAAHGLETEIAQESLSYNQSSGTLRGLHFQRTPHEEVKIIRCTRGSVFDVVVDLRADSPTYCKWVGIELSAENRRSVYLPRGMAHGFQTLADNTEIIYLISAFHAPEAAGGARHDDAAFGIAWPLAVSMISERDRNWPDFGSDRH